MDRSDVILGTHVFVALGLVAVGVLRVDAGNVIGGVLSGVMAVLVVGLGAYVARQY